jgi:hypothetical protein
MMLAKALRLAAAAVFCAALAACIPSTDTVADDVSRSSDKVILVGSFEITPSIPQMLNTNKRIARPLEEALFGSAEDALGSRLVTGFLPYGTRVSRTIYSTPWAGTTHSVPLDDLFFIEVDRTAIQLQPGQYFLSDSGIDSITLPGGLVTAAHPTAQVVYVGTVRYRRDDFFAITDVRVLDRFGQAAAEIKSRYGADTTIAKGLWLPAR